MTGIIAEQQKLIERMKFVALESETLQAANKEQISKTLAQLKEGTEDRQMLKGLYDRLLAQYMEFKKEAEVLDAALCTTRQKLSAGLRFFCFVEKYNSPFEEEARCQNLNDSVQSLGAELAQSRKEFTDLTQLRGLAQNHFPTLMCT